MDVYNKVFVKFEKNEIASLSKVFDAGNREAASGNFNTIMTLNGQNDKILSYFLSGYIESRYGIEELNKITDFLSENQRIYEKQDFLEIPELEKLKVVCDEMLVLKKAGLFHSAWDEMSFDDIKNFNMDNLRMETLPQETDPIELKKYKNANQACYFWDVDGATKLSNELFSFKENNQEISNEKISNIENN